MRLIGAMNVIMGKSKLVYNAQGLNMLIVCLFDVSRMSTDKYGNDQNDKTHASKIWQTQQVRHLRYYQDDEKVWIPSGNNSIAIRLSKNGVHVTFCIPIRTPEGVVWCANIKRKVTENTAEHTMAAVTMNIKKAHALLSHSNEQKCREIAQHLQWKITRGELGKCEACAIGKALQKNLGKGGEELSSKIGELWLTDGMSLKKKDAAYLPFPSNNCFNILIEANSCASIIGWYNTTIDFIDDFAPQINFIKQRKKIPLERLRCDNDGENHKLAETINGKYCKFNVTMEFTATKTPQQQSRAETKIYTIFKRVLSNMVSAKVPDYLRFIIFPYATKCVHQIRMLETIEIDTKIATRDEHLLGEIPKYANHLRIFGEAVTVKIGDNRTAKPEKKGKACMLVCYAKYNAGDVYVILDPNSPSFPTYKSRDVTFLNRMYFPKKIGADEMQPIVTISDGNTLTQTVDDIEQGSVGSDE